MAASTSTSPQSTPSTPFTFDLGEHLRRKFRVGPKYWDRFAEAANGKDGEHYVPRSGAHVTLQDLARDPSTLLYLSDGARPPREAADGASPAPAGDYKQQLSELGLEAQAEGVEVAGKGAVQDRLFFTLEDGTKVSVRDMYQYLLNNPERDALLQRRRRFPVADPSDPAGRPLPEGPPSGLERSGGLRVAVVGGEEAEELELDWGAIASGSIWRRRPTRWLGGWDGVKDWDVEVFAHEPFANQILGRKYGRRDPLRVLEDPAYAADVVRCGPLLGMTFVLTAARDLELKQAASSLRDLLGGYMQRQAPLVLPRRLRPTLVDPTDLNAPTWARLFSPGGATPAERAAERAAGADELGVSWRVVEGEEHEAARRRDMELLQSLPDAVCPGPDPSAWLLTRTPLVDPSGRHWRRGASLWLTLEPEGRVLVQAQSPGVISESKSWRLAQLAGAEALSGALMDSFLGPQPLDPHMAATARVNLMLPIHGFTAANKERDPNHPLQFGPPPRLPKVPADPSAFRLPPPGGKEPGQQGATLLSGISRGRAAAEVGQLLTRAAAAAAEEAAPSASSSPPSDGGRQEAALRALREGLAGLGPETRDWVLAAAAEVAAAPAPAQARVLAAAARSAERPELRLLPDLFSLARSLDAEDGEGAGGAEPERERAR